MSDFIFAAVAVALLVANVFAFYTLRQELSHERKRAERFLAALLMQRDDYGPARVVQDKQTPDPDKENPLARVRQVGMSIR